jgi:outer membrane protein OmpA-like peptidoglycan-associated protein
MRKLLMVLVITTLASLANGCVATRKFTRNEVKTSSDTLNARMDKSEAKTAGEISEVRDGVSRVDGRVTTVDGRVTQLDTKTNEQFTAVKSDVQNVDQKAGRAQQSADRVGGTVTALDSKFENRNQFTVATEKSIQFKFDSAKLDKQFQSDLDEIANLLTQNPNAVLILEGRTDSRGDADYNVKLGERRIEAVRQYLAVEKGVPVYKIHEISFGAAKPVAENNSKEGREKNRAVVLTVLTPKAGTGSQNQ